MQRPVTATVFGILHIVFAAFGVFGLIGNAVLLLAVPTSSPRARLSKSSRQTRPTRCG